MNLDPASVAKTHLYIEMSVEALFDAIKRGDPKPVDTYLEAEKDLNVKNEDGDTPLLYVTKLGLSYLVKRFLEHGANPDTRDANGDTSLIIASKDSTIYSTSRYRDPDTGALMLMYGNPPSTYKYPNSQYNTVTYLLDYGANHELKDNNGKTALYYAGKSESNQVELLLYNRYSQLNHEKRSVNSYPRVQNHTKKQLANIYGLNDNENEAEELVNTFGIYASESSSAPSSSAASSSAASSSAASSSAPSSSAAASSYEANMKNLQSSVNAKMSNFKGFRSGKNRKNRSSKKSNTRRRKA